MTEAPKEIVELVKRFEEQKDSYNNKGYKEASLRVDFLNPFFEALGWDVGNKLGYAEPYRDVVTEDRLRIGGETKAPDYSFRIGGEKSRKFFVEAKQPAVNIFVDSTTAYQLRRYAWSAHLSLSILTNFKQMSIYDCRFKPDKQDGAAVARVMQFKYEEYLTRWAEIVGIFSREAILKGSFDRYAEDTKAKRGTAEIDDVFLGEIDGWRLALARNFALRNPALSIKELNTAVQLTIDRLVFLRICESRGLEILNQLQGLLNGENIYGRLIAIYKSADRKYNSGLFHFESEKGRENFDQLTLGLSVDDKVLKEIISRLYYPESPYEFSAIPPEILGQVYERFLGKVIRLTEGHQAKVEEKPEVRKAGGVYYTPTYIVDYIVKNTVGKLVEGKTPEQAAKLKVFDPACGSGSFLIGAYQHLLDWHFDYYVKEPGKYAKGRNPALVQKSDGTFKLTLSERKRILMDNIFGVDIDAQAVEVTRLSLLLKVLEGENQQTLIVGRALPDLSSNIKCGNSLIGSDFLDGKQLDSDEIARINPFDWAKEFPQVFPLGKGESTNVPLMKGENTNNPQVPLMKGDEGGSNLAELKSYWSKRSQEKGFVFDKSFLPYNPKLKETSANLRKNMTPAEKKLWHEFFKSHEFRFLRQHPIDNYIVDFYCPKLSLVVEVDGDTHFEPKGVQTDKQRDDILSSVYKLGVVRISNEDVLKNFEGVCEFLNEEVLKLNPPTPLPKGGNTSIPFGKGESTNASLGKGDNTNNPQVPLVKGDKGGSGFDAVIGNPPYIRIQTMKEWAPKEVEFYKTAYKSASKGNYDIYVVFVERALSLLNQNGKLGFILPHKFFQSQFGAPIRELLGRQKAVNKIVHFGANQVFSNATTYTCLLFLTKQPNESFELISISDTQKFALGEPQSKNVVEHPTASDPWVLTSSNNDQILSKLKQQKATLGDITRKIFVGIQTSADKIYVLKILDEKNGSYLCYSSSLGKEVEIERDLVKPFLMGKDVHRYQPPVPTNVVIFPYVVNQGKAELMSQEYLKNQFPLGWKYLIENKKELENRENGKFKDLWWQFGRTNNLVEFETKKIMTPEIVLGCQFSYDSSSLLYHTTTIYSLVFNKDVKESDLFFLGILNSRLPWFFITSTGYVLRGSYFRFKTKYLEPFPIRTIDFSNKKDVAMHDKMVGLVEQMLDLNTRLQSAKLPNERDLLSRQIAATDRQIDQLVYELYGLTPDEIAIVEGLSS